MKLDHIKERLEAICRAADCPFALSALDELAEADSLSGVYAVVLQAPDSAWRRVMYRALGDWERFSNGNAE